MKPIQINVQVNFGLNTELYTLLSAAMERWAQAAEQHAAPKPSKPAKPQPKPEVANKPTEDKAETDKDAPKPQPAPEPEPQEAADPEPTQTEQAGQKEYTEVDVRAAMDRARKRIEGEDYKAHPDSEGYKRWHRALTAWFKNTAAVCDSKGVATKPSELSDSESRAKFIACCDEVTVMNDEITQNPPF